MAKYRNPAPLGGDTTYLSDGGMETTLIFHEGLELPHFASFMLLDTAEGRAQLTRYYERYLALAQRHGTGFVLDTATWRANADWGARLGYDAAGLDRINKASVALLDGLRTKWALFEPCVLSGAIGPRGDGYQAGAMAADEAQAYHGAQIASFADSAADIVSAYTLTGIEEAIGIARACEAQAMPCVISFTVETDGRMVTGRSLREAIEATDAATGGSPLHYMINCAHPSHFEGALAQGEGWATRIRGIRANASTRSHQELDESDTLDAGDPEDLARRYHALRQAFPTLKVLGGCCGTDHRHIAAICEECLPQAA